jgi:hypothetical protein
VAGDVVGMTASAPLGRRREAAAQFMRALTALQVGLELLEESPPASLGRDRERLMAALAAAVEQASRFPALADDDAEPSPGRA